MFRPTAALTTTAAERLALVAAVACARAFTGALGTAPTTDFPLQSGAV